MTPALLSLLLGFQSTNPIEPKAFIVYHHSAVEFSLSTKYTDYSQDYVNDITQKNFIAIEDPNGKFTVLVDNRAYPIKSLEYAAGIFNAAAQAGITGFDTSTELGQKATALVRGYEPTIHHLKPIEQPAIGVFVEFFVRPTGGTKWGSFPLEDRTQNGYLEKKSPELQAKIRARELPPAKGPVYYISQEMIRPYTTRVIMSDPKFDNYVANTMLKEASQLVSERFETALEAYRHGADSYITSLLFNLLGEIANRLPGELKLSDLPESLRENLVANMQLNPSRYGFDSENTLGEYLVKGGTFEIQPRLGLSVSTFLQANDDGSVARNSVGVILPLPTKPKKK